MAQLLSGPLPARIVVARRWHRWRLSSRSLAPPSRTPTTGPISS